MEDPTFCGRSEFEVDLANGGRLALPTDKVSFEDDINSALGCEDDIDSALEWDDDIDIELESDDSMDLAFESED